jgi:hypothetical protein
MDYLIRAAFTARVSAVCRRRAGAPSNRESQALLGRPHDGKFHLGLVRRQLAFSA